MIEIEFSQGNKWSLDFFEKSGWRGPMTHTEEEAVQVEQYIETVWVDGEKVDPENVILTFSHPYQHPYQDVGGDLEGSFDNDLCSVDLDGPPVHGDKLAKVVSVRIEKP